MYPKREHFITSYTKCTLQNWSYPKNFNHFYTGKSTRCLENRVKEQSSHTTSATDVHCQSNNHPEAETSHYRVTRPGQEAGCEKSLKPSILTRTNNSVFNHYISKRHILEILNGLLGVNSSPGGSSQATNIDQSQVLHIKPFKVVSSPEQCVCQIKH